MTGAAQTASTSSIFSRPLRVRCDATSGGATSWTVKLSASAPASRTDELEPDIEAEDQRGEREPLEGVAVVPGDVRRRLRPVAQQAVVAGAAFLHHRQRPQRPAEFGGVRRKVEILPDGPAGGAVEVEQ